MYQISRHSVSINRITKNNAKLIHAPKVKSCSVLRVARRPGLSSEKIFCPAKIEIYKLLFKEAALTIKRLRSILCTEEVS